MKPATTYEEQIEILKNRGLIIEDEQKALMILKNFNYYSFTGYLYQFKDSNENYQKDISFNKIYKIYLFDRKFRNILIQAIEIIEMSLKTKLSYICSHKIGPNGYTDIKNFKKQKEFEKFIKKFNDLKNKNKKLYFVHHHETKYNGDMPIWVATNLFTMGMIYNFYKNIYENNNKNLIINENNKMSIRKQLAKQYKTGAKQLKSWIENILYIRNMTAHYMRIYNVKLQKTPAKCYKNHRENYIVTNMIFDVIHIMKFLILDEKEWKNITTNIKALFDEYENYIDINLLGFPDDWEKILNK